jgi:Tol biopolymer transport system component
MTWRNLVVAVACWSVVGLSTSGQTGEAEAALEAARKTAVVDGNLAAAIKQYEAIASTYAQRNRPVAAQALLGMAECYQKQGDAQAQRVYSQIVGQYGDQPAAAAARAKLVAMGTVNTAPGLRSGDRVVWTDQAVFGDGDVSPDGRFVSDIDYETLKFILRDLSTHTTRVLAEWTGGASYTSTFSPDGKQLAYGWRIYGDATRPHVNEIRVIDVDRQGPSQPRRLYGSPSVSKFFALDWSPDGRWLAVFASLPDNTGQIALAGVHDGAYRVLKTVGWRGPGKMFFSADGRYLAYDLPTSDLASERDAFILAVDGSRETHIEHPANDVVMGWTPDGRLLLASDRSGSVGLWAVPVTDGRAVSAPSLLKPDIASVSSLGTTAAGTLFVVKDASTEGLYVAPIDLATGKLSGPAVLQSFRSQYPGWSRDGKYLSYVFRNASGIGVLAIRSAESGQVRELRPALEYFRADSWLPDGTALVTWGRDLKGKVGIYRIDAQSGLATRIANAESITGVQAAPDGRKIYYSSGPARFTELDLTTGETRETGTGGGRLSPDGRWFAGVRNDPGEKTSSVVILPAGGGERRTISTVKQPDQFEGRSLNWMPDSSAIVLPRRTGGDPGLWFVPLNGGQPRQLNIDMRAWDGSTVRLHPDGRQIAFFSGDSKREVYALELGTAPSPVIAGDRPSR